MCKATHACHCKLLAMLGVTCYTAFDNGHTGKCPASPTLSTEPPATCSYVSDTSVFQLSGGHLFLWEHCEGLSSPAFQDGVSYSESACKVLCPSSWVPTRLPSVETMAVPDGPTLCAACMLWLPSLQGLYTCFSRDPNSPRDPVQTFPEMSFPQCGSLARSPDLLA